MMNSTASSMNGLIVLLSYYFIKNPFYVWPKEMQYFRNLVQLFD